MQKLPKKHIKTITFILDSYPIDSQAFITNQLVGVLNAGCQIKIAVNKINALDGSSQESTINAYNVMRYVHKIETKNIIKGVFRYWQLLVLLFSNIQLSKSFFVILKSKCKDKLRLCEKLISYKELLKEDMFHIQFANNGQFLMTLKALGVLKQTTKIITTFHGYDAHFTEETLSLKQKELHPIFEYSDDIIVNSKYLKHRIIKLGCPETKISVIGVAYNSDIFKFNRKTDASTFQMISVGRLIELKGHIYGLKVLKALVSQNSNLHYTIIGEGEEKENLEAYIENENLSDYVSLVGAKSQLEIAEYLSKSNLFLMTSITDTVGRSEAFGVVSVEAQAVGVPVVAFNSGGVSETIKDGNTGVLVSEKDVDEMAKQITSLLANKEKMHEFSINASKFAKENFAQNKIIEKHIKVYNS